MQPGGIHLQPANVQAAAATGFKGLGTWRYRTETAAPPASGQVRFNNADPTLATEMYLHETNDGGTDVANFLDLLTDGAIIYLQEQSDADNHFIIEISSNTDSGTYRTFGIQAITLEGVEPSQNTQMLCVIGGLGSIVGPSTAASSVLRGDGSGGWVEELSVSIDLLGNIEGGALITRSVLTYTEPPTANTFLNILTGGVLISAPAGGTTHWEIFGEVRFEGDVYNVEKAAAAASFADMGEFWVRDDAENVPMFTSNFGNDLQLAGISAVGGTAQEVAFFNNGNSIEGDDNFQWDTSLNSGRVEIKCVDNTINNIGLFFIDPNSVLNPNGWQFCVGQAGLFDGSFILTSDPTDTINNRDVTFLPQGRPTFGFGIAIAPDTTISDENVGALAFFQPRDTTGREETKVSSVGFVGGTGHEGVFSIEGYNYGDAGLQFTRSAHFVVDADYRIHADFLGVLLMTGAAGLESGEDGIAHNLVDGLQIQGQGSSRDITMYDDSHQITLSSQTGLAAWRFHKRFQVGTYVEFHMNNATDDFEITGAGACDNILWTGYDGFFSIDSDLVVEGNGIFGPGTGSVTLDIDCGSADFLSGELRFLAAGVEQAFIQWFEFAAGGDSLLINSATGKMQLFTNNTLAMEIATDQSIRYTGTQEWDKGSDIASAATLVLGTDGNSFDVTGTTTITAISAKPIGTIILLQFDAVAELTHDATALDLQGDVDMVPAAGDTIGLHCYDGTNWREIFRNDGQQVRVSGSIADQAMVRGNGGAKRIQDTGNTIGDDDEIVMAGFIQFPTFTDAELNAIANAVNTTAAKVQGAQAYNSTQDVPVWAVGAADGSVWVDGAGTTVNTPV